MVLFEWFGVSFSVYGLGAALSAAIFVLSMRFFNRKSRPDAVSLALHALPLAFVFSRLFFCLARLGMYLERGMLSVLLTWEGGFLMWGALAGAALGAFIASKRFRSDFASTLDRMAVPAMASIALLRLFEYFTTEGRGLYLESNGFFCRFPFGVPNEFAEWQLAVFFWEAIAAAIILAVLFRHSGAKGDKALLMLVTYSAAQILFESLRVDASPKWGFVRVSQTLSAVVLFGASLTRANMLLGKRKAATRALVTLFCIAAVGILEWALDKSPLPVWACYGLMCAAMAIALLVACPGKRHRRGFTDDGTHAPSPGTPSG